MTLFVGLDAAADAMAEAANKATRRRLPNLLYAHAAVERLPQELLGTAGRITVNFPWGSLLRALAQPEVSVLSAIAALGRPGAALMVLVNMATFDDAAYCAKLGLPCPPVFASEAAMRAAYARAGVQVLRIDGDLRALPHRTTWGQRLTKGTQRRVLRLDAQIL